MSLRRRVGGVRQHAAVDQVDRAEAVRPVDRDGGAVDDDVLAVVGRVGFADRGRRW